MIFQKIVTQGPKSVRCVAFCILHFSFYFCLMKKSYFILLKLLIFVFCLLPFISCTQNDNKPGSGNLIKKEVMDIALKYARDKFKEPKETVAKNGIVTISENQQNFVTLEKNQLEYTIDPSEIVTGLINDDSGKDAIITISSARGQYLEAPEHLILIKTDGKLMLNRVVESEMTVIGIKDMIITAEVRSHSRNTPLRDCSVCKEVVKYQFRDGDLIRIE